MAARAEPDLFAYVRNGIDCWNRHEFDEMADLYVGEDAVLDVTRAFPDGGIVRGRERVRAFLYEWWETWEGVRMDTIDVLDAGDGRVVADVRIWGRGKRSGVEVDQRLAFLYTLGEDRMVRSNEWFPDVDAALEAADGRR
jgi:ketosteroid isomerase-like protein